MKFQNELLESYNLSKFTPPENENYEDSYSFALDEFLPVKYILAGMTKPFSAYKNHRPAAKKHHLFEYLVSGSGYIFINSSWQKISAGDCFLLNKDDERNFYADEKDPMQKIYVSFASEYIDSMLLHYGVSSGVYRVDVKECFEGIYQTARSSELSQDDKIFKITESIHKIIMTVASAERKNKIALVDKIKESLVGAVFTKADLGEIAKKFYISKSSLIRIFKARYGITPYRFLLDEKIKVAKLLFSTTNLSVKSVSEKLGFADEHYFSHLFKQMVGLSAVKYRNQAKYKIN